MGLSEVSQAYLEHLLAIKRGEAALAADIARLLRDAMIAQPAQVNDERVKRSWDFGGIQEAVTARLSWELDADTGATAFVPWLDLHPAVEATVGEMLRRHETVAPPIEWRALVAKDAAGTIRSSWERLAGAVEGELVELDHTRTAHALRVMAALIVELGGRARDDIARAGLSGGTAIRTRAPHWPAYIELQQEKFCWDLTHLPGDRALVLVLWHADRSLARAVVPDCEGLHAECPIVADFSDRLDAPTGELVAAIIQKLLEGAAKVQASP